MRAVAKEVRALGHDSFSLLDVACGSADIPLAVARWAAGTQSHGADRRQRHQPADRRASAQRGGERAERHHRAAGRAGAALSRAGASTSRSARSRCTTSIRPNAVSLLRELARVGRRVLVFDIQRARLAYAGSVALVNLLAMHPMTRHDAPASVRRSYSAAELRALAAEAGLHEARVTVRFPFRLALDGDRRRIIRGGKRSQADARRRGACAPPIGAD